MVSPRRYVPQQSKGELINSKSIYLKIKSIYNKTHIWFLDFCVCAFIYLSDQIKTNLRQVLARRKFYLDLKSRGAASIKQLIQDLNALGGVSNASFIKILANVFRDFYGVQSMYSKRLQCFFHSKH